MTADDWLLVAILSHALVVLGVLAYLAVVREESWLSPIIVFVGFLELFTLPLAVRALHTLVIEGDVTEHLPQILPYFAPSLWLVTGGLLVFVTCYYLPITSRWAARLPRVTMRQDRSPYVAAAVLGLFCVLVISMLAHSTGGILPFILLGYGGTAKMFGKGYLALGFPWLFIAAMMPLVSYAVRRRRRDLVVFAAAFVVLTAMNVAMGNRSGVMFQLIAVVVFWHLCIARVSLLRFLPAMVIGFLALNLIGYVRQSEYQNVGDLLSRSQEAFGSIRENGELGTGATYTLSSGEFVVPFESLPTIMRGESDRQIDFRLGATFLGAFAFFIPNALWADRPVPLATWYMRQFYGSGTRANEGRQFFFLAEGYLNFGPVGIALLMAAWGLSWGTVGAYMRQRAGSMDAVAALCIAVGIAYIFRGIAGDASTMLVGLPEQALVPALLCGAYLAGGPVSTGAIRHAARRYSTASP